MFSFICVFRFVSHSHFVLHGKLQVRSSRFLQSAEPSYNYHGGQVEVMGDRFLSGFRRTAPGVLALLLLAQYACVAGKTLASHVVVANSTVLTTEQLIVADIGAGHVGYTDIGSTLGNSKVGARAPRLSLVVLLTPFTVLSRGVVFAVTDQTIICEGTAVGM